MLTSAILFVRQRTSAHIVFTEAGLKVAAKDEAEAAKIKMVKAAEAEGERTRIQAEAEAEATYLSGVGMARQVSFPCSTLLRNSFYQLAQVLYKTLSSA